MSSAACLMGSFEVDFKGAHLLRHFFFVEIPLSVKFGPVENVGIDLIYLSKIKYRNVLHLGNDHILQVPKYPNFFFFENMY